MELRRNYGKYSQYTEELTPAIGEVYNIDFYRPLYDITNGQSLLDYTHNNREPYGTSITNQAFLQSKYYYHNLPQNQL